MSLPAEGRPPTLRNLRSRRRPVRSRPKADEQTPDSMTTHRQPSATLGKPWRQVATCLADHQLSWDPGRFEVAAVRVELSVENLASWASESTRRPRQSIPRMAEAVSSTMRYRFQLWATGPCSYVGLASRIGTRAQSAARLSETFAHMTEMALREDPTTLIDFRLGLAFLGDRPTVELMADVGLEVVDCAEQALRATTSERPTVVYGAAVAKSSAEAATTASDLSEAVGNDDIQLAYQARRSVHGPTVGVESLARWYHWQRGPVNNAELLRVAEQTGRLPALGRRLRLRAAQTASHWADHGLLASNQLYVNAAPVEICHRSFLPSVRELRRLHPSICLIIELTDSDRLDIPFVRRALRQQARDGCHFILDGLGPETVSIERVKDLPLVGLTLAGGFSRPVESDDTTRRLAEAIMVLAHQRELVVTAAHIETKDQLETARDYQVDHVQGDFFSPAVPAARFAETIV